LFVFPAAEVTPASQTDNWQSSCKLPCMNRTSVSKIALMCQIFSASAGLSLGAVGQDHSQPGQVTADQQKSNKADRELTQNIRKAIVGDKSLSMSAHNVKVISRNGTVTLKGKVTSDQEKKAIEDKATELAGPGNVTDELTVSSK